MNRICWSRISQIRLLNGEIERRSGLGIVRCLSTTAEQTKYQRLHSTDGDKEINPDEPIKFFGSEAAKWKAHQTRSGQSNSQDRPWFQPYVIMGSVMVFMIYFCVLREESDVDGELNKSLYDRVDGLEEIQLKILHKYNLENQVDNVKVEGRMKELNMPIPKY